MTARSLGLIASICLLGLSMPSTAQDSESQAGSDAGSKATVDLPLIGEVTLPGFLSFLGGENSSASESDESRQASGPGDGGQAPPPAVVFHVVEKQSVGEEYRFIGRMAAIQQVAVQSRVSGYIQTVEFQGGESVSAGDLLFRIEPDRYEAELEAAAAQRAGAEAQLAEAERQLDRDTELRDSNTVSQATLDESRAAAESARAALQQAQANERLAKLDLDYTTIEAPIDGQMSEPLVTAGNYVSGAGSTLANLVQLDPIWGVFPIGENQIVTWRRLGLAADAAPSVEDPQALEANDPAASGDAPAQADGSALSDDGAVGNDDPVDTVSTSGSDDQDGEGAASSRSIRRPVDYVFALVLPDGTPYDIEGRFDFVGNTVDTSTGTVEARVRFPNPQDFLLPNQNVTLVASERDPPMRPVVPQSAIQLSRDGRSVWVVSDNNTASRRMVEVEPREASGLAVISDGLNGGERVVVRGAMNLQDGMTVRPRPETGQAIPGGGAVAGQDDEPGAGEPAASGGRDDETQAGDPDSGSRDG